MLILVAPMPLALMARILAASIEAVAGIDAIGLGLGDALKPALAAQVCPGRGRHGGLEGETGISTLTTTSFAVGWPTLR